MGYSNALSMAIETDDWDFGDIEDGDTQDDGIVDEPTHDTMRPPEDLPQYETLPRSTREAVEALDDFVVRAPREEEIISKICANANVEGLDLRNVGTEHIDGEIAFAEYRCQDPTFSYVYITPEYNEPAFVEFDEGLRVSVKHPDAPVLLKVHKKPGHTEELFHWTY